MQRTIGLTLHYLMLALCQCNSVDVNGVTLTSNQSNGMDIEAQRKDINKPLYTEKDYIHSAISQHTEHHHILVKHFKELSLALPSISVGCIHHLITRVVQSRIYWSQN